MKQKTVITMRVELSSAASASKQPTLQRWILENEAEECSQVAKISQILSTTLLPFDVFQSNIFSDSRFPFGLRRSASHQCPNLTSTSSSLEHIHTPFPPTRLSDLDTGLPSSTAFKVYHRYFHLIRSSDPLPRVHQTNL
jgi:hypothetical protein